jgi:hypothetical protein
VRNFSWFSSLKTDGGDIWGRLRLNGIQVKWEIVEVCLESNRRNLLELSLVFYKDPQWLHSLRRKSLLDVGGIFRNLLRRKSLLDVGGTFQNLLRRESLLDVCGTFRNLLRKESLLDVGGTFRNLLGTQWFSI